MAFNPDWLNVEFMNKVLRNFEKDPSIKVTDISLKPATAKGDNYTSDMIRATVDFTRNVSGRKVDEKRSLIVKVSPTVDGIQKDMIADIGLFDTEINMMETTLCKMNDMLSGEGYTLGAHVLYTERGDPSLLVLEDLAALGFRMADRQAGLDLHHSKLAMRALAKFHASSVALVEKEPEIVKMYKKGIFHDDHPDDMRKFFVDGLRTMAKEVREWPELGAPYADKIEKLLNCAFSKAAACARVVENEFKVINHGDFWVNNMLFRYNEEGKATDHIFVDFQLCVWTSPAVDILYFMNTSPSDDVELNHRETLLEVYLENLKDTMSRLGCKTQPPSMADLKKSLEERQFYGVLSACTILPLVVIDKSEAKSLDEIMQPDGSYDNPAYKGAIYRKTMLRRLPKWNALGLLDV